MNNLTVDNQRAPISEIAFTSLPQAVKDWIQELGWKQEDIYSVHIENEILPDGETIGEDGKKWKHVKQGKRVDVTLSHMQKKKKRLQFVRLGDGAW